MEKNNYAYIAIVAIVAVVALVVLMSGKGAVKVVNTETTDAEQANIAGEASAGKNVARQHPYTLYKTQITHSPLGDSCITSQNPSPLSPGYVSIGVSDPGLFTVWLHIKNKCSWSIYDKNSLVTHVCHEGNKIKKEYYKCTYGCAYDNSGRAYCKSS